MMTRGDRSSQRLRVSAASVCGPVRLRNEDMVFCGSRCLRDGALEETVELGLRTAPYLVGVCDGMGGHSGGAEASALVSQRLVQTVGRWRSELSAAEIAAGLAEALHDAHRELAVRAMVAPADADAGTTCTALCWASGAITLAHVGDSRCYRGRDGFWMPLTMDHTEPGVPGALTFAVGGRVGQPLPETFVHDHSSSCLPGDVFVVMSDGVLAALGGNDPEALEAVLCETSADVMVAMALRQRGPDNVSVVRVEVLP